MGELVLSDPSVSSNEDTPVVISDSVQQEAISRARKTIESTSFSNKRDDEQFISFLR